MSKSVIPPQTDTVAAGVPSRDDRRLKWTIIAIILLLAGALGLKAWEERQTADSTLLGALEANSSTIAARLSGHAGTAEMAMRLIADAGASRSAVASATPGVDVVVSLQEARLAPEGSRLLAAVPVVEAMLAGGHRIGLSGQGDIVVATTAPDGEIILALAPAGTWLPASRAGTGIFVTDKHLSAGTILPGTAGMLPATKFRALGLLDRAATGCAPVGGSALQVCTSQATPLFTLDDFIRLLIFGLLLAAPMLVILGLMNQLSREPEVTFVERAQEIESDRFMSPVMLGVRAGYWEWSDDSSAVYLSDAASELMGMLGDGEITIDEMLPQVHPEHQKRVQDAFRKGYKDGWVQTSFVTSFQPARWMELRGSVTPHAETGANVYGGRAQAGRGPDQGGRTPTAYGYRRLQWSFRPVGQSQASALLEPGLCLRPPARGNLAAGHGASHREHCTGWGLAFRTPLFGRSADDLAGAQHRALDQTGGAPHA